MTTLFELFHEPKILHENLYLYIQNLSWTLYLRTLNKNGNVIRTLACVSSPFPLQLAGEAYLGINTCRERKEIHN